jgi:hypothetical protein
MDSYILSRRLCIVLSRIVIVFGALLLEVSPLKRQVNITLYFLLSLFSLFLCSWVLHYILCDFSKVLGLSTLQVVSELFLGHEVGEFLGTKFFFFSFCMIFDGKKRMTIFRSIYETFCA